MKNLLPASLILAAGVALGGFCPGYYYYQTKVNNNTVVVKGLAEMNVKADLAIWKLKFVTTGNELAGAQKNITDQANQIVAFLKEQGFNETEINVERIETNDLMANPYRNGNVTDNTRFILTQTITVKSGKVGLQQNLRQTPAVKSEKFAMPIKVFFPFYRQKAGPAAMKHNKLIKRFGLFQRLNIV